MVSLVIISLWPKKCRIFPNDSKSNSFSPSSNNRTKNLYIPHRSIQQMMRGQS